MKFNFLFYSILFHIDCRFACNTYLGVGKRDLAPSGFRKRKKVKQRAQWAKNRAFFLMKFGTWEDVDLSLDNGNRQRCHCVLVQWLASSAVLVKIDTQIHAFLRFNRKVAPCSAH